jgi:hypothetical protein
VVYAQVDVPPVSRSAARRLRRTARRLLKALPPHVPEPAITAREIVWAICVDDPDRWSQPEAPLADLLDVAGLVTAHGWVALPGTDLDGYALVAPPPLPPEVTVGLFDEPMIEPHDLDLVGRAVHQERFGSLSPDREFRSRLADVLAAPEAVAAVSLMWGQDPGLEGLCHEPLAEVDGPALATVETLLARAAARRGEVEEVTRRLVAALAADPRCEQAHRDAAEMAELRGDVATGERHRLDLVDGSAITVGQLVLGRILDNGSGSWLSYGAASVPEHVADDVAAWLAEGVGGAELARRLAVALDVWRLVAEQES